MYGRTDKLVAGCALALSSAVLMVAAWLRPSAAGYGTHTQLGLPPCNFLRLTHLPCPSCGMTTCFALMMRLEIVKAFLANPFGILAFAFTALAIPLSLYLLWRRISFRRITEHAYFTKTIYTCTALYFLSWMFKLAEFHHSLR